MRKTRKLLSAVLSLIMILSCLPLTAVNGFAYTTEDGYEYTTKGGYCYITGYSGEETYLEIPEAIGTYTVKGIADGAFEGNTQITNVYISSGIQELGVNSFKACTNLFDVRIPATVTSITTNMFEGCTNLINVIIEYNATAKYTGLRNVPILFDMQATELGTNTSTLYNVVGYQNSSVYSESSGFLFSKGGKTLVRVPSGSVPAYYNIPKGTTTIADHAFAGCQSLEGIRIPSSVSEIGEYVFINCPSLEDVTLEINPDIPLNKLPEAYDNLGRRVTQVYIPDKALFDEGDYANFCQNLRYYDVSDSHPLYSSHDDGVLYSKDMSVLLSYPLKKAGKKFTVWGDTKKIADWAFSQTALEEVVITADLIEIGENSFCDCKDLRKVTLPSTLKKIGEGAFSYADNLAEINLPDSIEEIGEYAFDNCYHLTQVVLPKSLAEIKEAAFEGCISLESVVIPDGVVSIGSWAFCHCDSLTEITIPYSVREIHPAAFLSTPLAKIYGYENSAAQAFALENNIEFVSLGETVCQHSRSVEEVVEPTCTEDGYIRTVCAACGEELSYEVSPAIGHDWSEAEYSFSYDYVTATAKRVCSNDPNHIETETVKTTWVVIKEAIPEINQNGITEYTATFTNPAFKTQKISVETDITVYTSSDGKWNYVKRPDGTVEIFHVAYNKAYLGTQSVVKVPEKIDSMTVFGIGDYAFYNCSFVKSVSLPATVAYIGKNAFEGCTGLTTLTLNDGITQIGDEAFKSCSALKIASVPDSVTELGKAAFEDCTSLESVTLSANMTMLKADTFNNCISLTSVSLPDIMYVIWEGAFKGCIALTDITLPESLKTVCEEAFRGTSLKSVSLPSQLGNIYAEAFADCTALELVRWPKSTSYVRANAFSGCNKLADIYYEGSEANWKKISLGTPNTEILNAKIHYNVTGDHEYTVVGYTPASCEEDGIIFYSCPCGYERQEVVPAPGHRWNDTVYEWSADNSHATATRTCKRDASHVETETVRTSVVEIPPTCEQDGRLIYTAVFSNADFATQQKAVPSGELAGHKWSNISYTWAQDNSTVTAIRVCTVDSSHVESETVGVSFELVKPATATSTGLIIYTGEFKNPVFGTISRAVVIPRIADSTAGFPDVKESDWYYEAAKYCSDKGFITGYSNGNFGPANKLERQDFVIILARIAGADLSAYEGKASKFSDASASAYYAAAVGWASDNGIVGGYTNGKFGVGDSITREQVCTILYRYMGSPEVTGVEEALAPFNDADRISDFAADAVVWAIQNGVISGKNATTLAPTATASRAEIATIVMRMDIAGMFSA